jgi:predicted RNA-binding protein with TRAM domain
MRVTIEKAGINGEGIAYLDQKPVFIDGALPTEVVEIELTQSNPTYHRAKVLRRVSDHPQRIVPPCPVQAECGGCALMIADVSLQHALKLEHLKQSLRKYVGSFGFPRDSTVGGQSSTVGLPQSVQTAGATRRGSFGGWALRSRFQSLGQSQAVFGARSGLGSQSNPRSCACWNGMAKKPLILERSVGYEPWCCAGLTGRTN